MSDFIIGRVQSLEELTTLEAEWRALEPRMVQLPFFCFDWLAAWWQHLRSDRSAIKDELCVFTFRRPDKTLCGVAPMMVTCRPGKGPLRLRQLQFFGADTNITEVRGIAAAAEDMQPLYHALLEHLRKAPVACDWMKLTGIPGTSDIFKKVEADFGAITWTRDVPNFYLNMLPTWAEFKTSLSRNIKESLRKCYNAPKREGLEFDFTTIDDASQADAAVAEFLRLHNQRSQATDTISHADVFRNESSQQFLFDVCRRFAKRGHLRVFQLKHQGAVIACRIGFVMGDSLYLYYSGYNPDYSKYSVMTTTVAEAIQYAIGQGFKTVNLSTGRDVSKERWSPEEIMYQELEVASPSAWGAFKYRAYNTASRNLKSGPLAGLVGKLVARNAP
ncbi:MAG: GNAT family N-acetyltransferase [Steroidobacteraceae bacterium]